MKIIEKGGFQGDVAFVRVDKLPENAVLTKEGRRVVVAHSETGHHHVAVAEKVRLYGVGDPMVCYLASEGAYTDVVHEREHDQHEALRLPTGTWKVVRQREWAPEGWRRVED